MKEKNDPKVRILTLEVETKLKFEQIEIALILARDQIEKDKILARDLIEKDKILARDLIEKDKSVAKDQVDQRIGSIETSMQSKIDIINFRLEETNNLRQEISGNRGMYFLKESHEKYEKETTLWKDSLRKQLTDSMILVNDRIASNENRARTWISVFAFIAILATLLGAFLK